MPFIQEGDWLDTMQVCGNGHIITRFATSQPTTRKNRCPRCGEKTITECPSCNHIIPGHRHIPGVAYIDDGPLPVYCEGCGKPFPWKTEAVRVNSASAIVMNRIFVVHGHDEEMKQVVARTVTSLGLEPVILHEQPNEGKTIIEKFEKHADVSFAIVLLSPDDMAYPKVKNGKDARARARQNVILELGYFAGKLGRSKVFSLYRGGSDFELPSDFAGVIYTPYDVAAGAWRFDLVRELKAAGYAVDANKLI